MSAVLTFSLIPLELWLLQPCTLMIPCSLSIWLRVTDANSCPSNPVSFSIVNMVAYLRVADEIILSMFAVLGIIGIFLSHL